MSTPEQELDQYAELLQLQEKNQALYNRLAAAGARVDGMNEHYVVTLLETLLGTAVVDLLTPAKLVHERWLVGQLEAAERTYQSVVEARAEHERRQREEAIRRGAPATTPAGPRPALKNVVLGQAVERTDSKHRR